MQGGLIDNGHEREGPRVRILVAEDDRRLADLLDQSLTEAGWDVEVAHDGRSAYGRALPDGVPYDVLLLDWMLPEMDGVTVCRRLRALGLTTPVLMLTARGDVRDRIDGLDAGPTTTSRKPFDLDELLARLRALVRRSTYAEQTVVRGRRPRRRPGGTHRLPRRDSGGALGARVRRPPPARLPGRAGRVALHHPRRGLGRRDRPAQQRHRRPPRVDPRQDRPAVRDQHHHHRPRRRLPGRPGPAS